MTFDSKQLIDDLSARVSRASTAVARFRAMDDFLLNEKQDGATWSVLECIEHLNLYGDYYLPEIERSILAGTKGTHGPDFKSGILGGYFAKLMQVSPDGRMKKMKTPRDKNPAGSLLTNLTIERFLNQQDRLLALLEQARRIDLTRAKTSVSISKFVRLRLGDTFRFFIYHIERHVMQAEKVAGHSVPLMERVSS
ncbi:MAG: DinB family protein [Chitinophagaceae bacterium]